MHLTVNAEFTNCYDIRYDLKKVNADVTLPMIYSLKTMCKFGASCD